MVNIFIIVVLSILLLAVLGISVFLYSYNIYTKNCLFTIPKVSAPLVIVSSIIIALILITGICGVYFSAVSTSVDRIYHIIQSILVLAVGSVLLVEIAIYVNISKKHQEGKIHYLEIKEVDWNKRMYDIAKSCDLSKIKNELSQKHKKYYQNMVKEYERVIDNAGRLEYSEADKMADIIIFNEKFTSKWSTEYNKVQLFLTYEFCRMFNK